MTWARTALALTAAGVAAAVLFSGGSPVDPRTPAALPGLPPPFLGTAVVGGGGLTAAVDAYGNLVDLRRGPAGPALIENPAARQAAGSVAVEAGIVPRVGAGGGPSLPLWRARSVAQRYRPGTNVLVVEAGFGATSARVVYAARGGAVACLTRADRGARVSIGSASREAAARLRCDDGAARRLVRAAERSDRRWLSRARPLAPSAPAWSVRLYRRSLLTLRALTDRRTGAVAAGARDGWAYVWPRDAGATALALAAAGYEAEARRVARFLLRLDLAAAARFHGDGTPVPGRAAQGDAGGWVAAAARAAGLPAPGRSSPPWRNRPDYQERAPGDYLANALAAAKPRADGPKTSAMRTFSAHRQLLRRAGDGASGLDSAAAWAVRPFARPALFPAVRRTLSRLAATGTRYGIVPSEDWEGVDPWSAPTAWTAWSLAALSRRERRQGSTATARHDRRAALRLLVDLRRAATPAGALPERVDVRTGIPTSTTPLAWSHAFAVLALRELWP